MELNCCGKHIANILALSSHSVCVCPCAIVRSYPFSTVFAAFKSGRLQQLVLAKHSRSDQDKTVLQKYFLFYSKQSSCLLDELSDFQELFSKTPPMQSRWKCQSLRTITWMRLAKAFVKVSILTTHLLSLPELEVRRNLL